MDSRRAPAVLLLIKTVVITFPTLSERGLRGAAAWCAENVSARQIGSSLPAPDGCEDGHPLDAEGGSAGAFGAEQVCACIYDCVVSHTPCTHTGKILINETTFHKWFQLLVLSG